MKKIITLLAIVFYLSTNAQMITSFAGNGTAGYSGDGGQATAAELNNPQGMRCDAMGNLYLADYNNNCIRKISTSGIITTIAGTGTAGYSGDGGPATAAKLNGVRDLCLDPAGNIYIPDMLNQRIRKINTAGIITTIAGTGANGFFGDGGPAINAQFANPATIAMDASGNLYISDAINKRVRKISTGGIITTIAGTGGAGNTGDGGPATAATFMDPCGLAVDGAGNIYVADQPNNKIRKIDGSGIITAVVGTGAAGSSGDGGQAINAQLASPWSIAFDASGNLLIADGSGRVRSVNTSGIINTIAGNGFCCYTQSGPALTTPLGNVAAVAVDTGGYVFISAGYILELIPCNTPLNLSISGPNSVCTGNAITLTAGGASTYTWSSNAGTAHTSTVSVSPTSNTTYTVSGVAGVCSGTATISITVNPLPVITVNSATVCPNTTGTLTATGATTYTWNTGVIGASITPTPSVTTHYTVSGTNSNNCTNVATATITVSPGSISGFSGPNPLCIIQGNPTTTTITANGASTYTWSSNAGGANTNTVVVNPAVSDVYTLTASNGVCVSQATYSINIVSSLIPPTIKGPDTVCTTAQVITYTATGAPTYTWTSNNALYGHSINDSLFQIGNWSMSFYPGTATLTVIGIDPNGCKDTAKQIVTYYQPNVTLTSPYLVPNGPYDYRACGTITDTLTANGANSYTWWSPASANTPTLAVNYPAGYVYCNLVGYGNLGCPDTATFFIHASQPSVSYVLTQDAAPQTWDVYPTYPPNATHVTWYWGDGDSSNTFYPSHVYAIAGTYSICVTVLDTFGCSATYCQNDSVYRMANNSSSSSMVYVNVLAPTTSVINASAQNEPVTVFPNPTANQFFIEANTNDKLTVDLYDVNGRHVFSANVIGKENINVADLDKGAYTLTITRPDRVINKKLVILR